MAPATRSRKGSKQKAPSHKKQKKAPKAAVPVESSEDSDDEKVKQKPSRKPSRQGVGALESTETIKARMAADQASLERMEAAELLTQQILALEAQRDGVLSGSITSTAITEPLVGGSDSAKAGTKSKKRVAFDSDEESDTDDDDSDEEIVDEAEGVSAEVAVSGEGSPKTLIYSHILRTWRAESKLEAMKLAKPEMKRVLRLLKSLPVAARKHQKTLRGYVKELQILYMKYRFDQTAAEQFAVNSKSNSSGGRISQKEITVAVKQVRLRDPTQSKNGQGATSQNKSDVRPKAPTKWNQIDNRANTTKAKKTPATAAPRACYVCGSTAHMAPQCDQKKG
jgi:hypothetical protein